MKVLRLSTLLAAVMITAGSIGAMAQKSNEAMPITTAPQVKTLYSDVIIGDQKVHPLKVTIFYFNEESNDYDLFLQKNYELDELGRPVFIKERHDPNNEHYSFTEIIYDEEGRVSVKQDGNTPDLPRKQYVNRLEYIYDYIFKDFVTDFKMLYNDEICSEPEWEITSHDVHTITRDEQNRALKVTSTNGYSGPCYEAIESIYGQSSSPEKVIYINYQGNGEERYRYEYSDIDWYTCDNQILSGHQMQNIPYGKDPKNKINKVYFTNIDKWNHGTELFTMTYDDKGRITSTKRQIVNDDGTLRLSYYLDEYSYTDDYGSYEKTTYDVYDYNSNHVIEDDEISKTDKLIYVYDEHGNNILYESYKINGDTPNLSESYNCDIEYDEEGRITQTIEKNNFMYNSNIIKTVYEYSVPTGIKNVEHKTAKMRVYDSMIALGTNAECAYSICNAEGKMVMSGSTREGMISTASLPSGFYIVSVNNGNGTSSVKFVK